LSKKVEGANDKGLTTLVDALDQAAASLLRQTTSTFTVEGAPPVTPSAPLADQVKAFEAAVSWAETRSKIVEKPKPRSAFDDIRNRVNGHAPRGRGTPAPPSAEEDAGASPE
jgi:hypothetical protein